jgi:hypothetical protein
MKSTHHASKGLGAMTSEERQKIKTVLTKLNYSIEFVEFYTLLLPKETIFLNPSLRDVKDFHVLRKTK